MVKPACTYKTASALMTTHFRFLPRRSAGGGAGGGDHIPGDAGVMDCVPGVGTGVDGGGATAWLLTGVTAGAGDWFVATLMGEISDNGLTTGDGGIAGLFPDAPPGVGFRG